MKTNQKNKNKLQDNNKDFFNSFAKKLRLEKINKEEINKYKTEAIKNEKQKQKKKKSAIFIQKIFKGYLLRKKFSKLLEKINTETIIEYLLEKRRQRIQKNANEIIGEHVMNYINALRQKRKDLIIQFYHYSVNNIIKTWRGYKVRRMMKPSLGKVKLAKDRILALFQGYKTRGILRSFKMQDLLVEIANLKHCVNNLDKEGRNSSQSEKLQYEFQSKLTKNLQSFRLEFRRLKESNIWVDMIKVDHRWIMKYLSIIWPNLKSVSFNDGLDRENNFLAYNYNKGNNAADKTMADKINDSRVIRQRSNFRKNTRTEEMKLNDPDDRPINANPNRGYDLSAFPESQKGENELSSDLPKKKIEKKPARPKKPKYDARKAIEEASAKQPAPEKEERSTFRNMIREIKNQNKPSESQPTSNINSTNGLAQINKSPKNSNSSNIVIGSANLASTAVTLNNNNNNNNFSNTEAKKGEDDNTRRGKRVVTKEINMRRKLHEMEKSPPPKVDIKNIKSKIDCWGSENNISTVKKFKMTEKEDLKNLFDGVNFESINRNNKTYRKYIFV